MRIGLTINGSPRVIDTQPLRRLLDILREDLGLTGSKEGCGEGECGACAVLMNGHLVNSCLVPALQLDGSDIVTIEGLGAEGAPDPIAAAFLAEGAVQCGFCIPGMVMAARSLLDRNPRPSREEIREGLAGNLCRCTGYERIIRAVERASGAVDGHRLATAARAVAKDARPSDAAASVDMPVAETAFSPRGLDEALAILREWGDGIRIVAGATDLLTSVKLGIERPRVLLDISRIAALRGIAQRDRSIEIGAATTLSEIADDPLVRRILPALARAAELFGAVAIQNRATLGGNLMSASPAADSPPALTALDAVAVLVSANGAREVPIRAFFTGYRQTARRPDEILSSIRIPIPADGARQAFHKIGTRRAQSIAKVSLACCARLDSEGHWREVRLAAGSVAPIPLSLEKTERCLEGRKASRDAVTEAIAIAQSEIRPIDDIRSTEIYRRTIAGRLLRRFLEGFLE
jgi:xanthine dehydrogenase small subunit